MCALTAECINRGGKKMNGRDSKSFVQSLPGTRAMGKLPNDLDSGVVCERGRLRCLHARLHWSLSPGEEAISSGD